MRQDHFTFFNPGDDALKDWGPSCEPPPPGDGPTCPQPPGPSTPDTYFRIAAMPGPFGYDEPGAADAADALMFG